MVEEFTCEVNAENLRTHERAVAEHLETAMRAMRESVEEAHRALDQSSKDATAAKGEQLTPELSPRARAMLERIERNGHRIGSTQERDQDRGRDEEYSWDHDR